MSTNGAWVNGVFYDGIELTAADLNANNNWLLTQAASLVVPNTWTAIQTFGADLVIPAVTTASLPASPVDGQRAYVNDATSTTFAAAPTGGGTHHVPVWYSGDASAWKIG